MKNRRIGVSISRTISDGNYGSYKCNTFVETDIDDNADIDSEFDTLYMITSAELQKFLVQMQDDIE